MRIDKNSWIVQVAYQRNPLALAEKVWDGRWPEVDEYDIGHVRTSLCALSWRTAGMLVYHATLGTTILAVSPVIVGGAWIVPKIRDGFYALLYAFDEKFGDTIEEKAGGLSETLIKTANNITAWDLWKSLGSLKKKACPIVEIE